MAIIKINIEADTKDPDDFALLEKLSCSFLVGDASKADSMASSAAYVQNYNNFRYYGSRTGRSSAVGAKETAAGETAAGETAAGETAAGETAAGETAAGETAAGETAAGETAAGETAAGETAAGETAAGETAAGETAAEEPVADSQIKECRKPRGKPRPGRAADTETPGECAGCANAAVNPDGWYCSVKMQALPTCSVRCGGFNPVGDPPAPEHPGEEFQCRCSADLIFEPPAPEPPAPEQPAPEQPAPEPPACPEEVPFGAFIESPETVQPILVDPAKVRQQFERAILMLKNRSPKSLEAFAKKYGLRNSRDVADADLTSRLAEVEKLLINDVGE